MRKLIIEMPYIPEVIPSDEAFAESYIKRIRSARLQKTIHVGIADADAGKLIDLATVKTKWLSRWLSQR